MMFWEKGLLTPMISDCSVLYTPKILKTTKETLFILTGSLFESFYKVRKNPALQENSTKFSAK